MRRLAWGLERVELLQELGGLVDDHGACSESSAEDLESMSLWRTGLEETELGEREGLTGTGGGTLRHGGVGGDWRARGIGWGRSGEGGRGA